MKLQTATIKLGCCRQSLCAPVGRLRRAFQKAARARRRDTEPQAEVGDSVTIVRARADEEGREVELTLSDGSTETLDGLWVIKDADNIRQD